MWSKWNCSSSRPRSTCSRAKGFCLLLAIAAAVFAEASAKAAGDEPAVVGGGDVFVMPSIQVIGENLPGSGQRIETEEIRTQSYDDVNRVLRKVPGVIAREEDGYGLFPNLSLRGVDTNRSSKVTIMEDGVLQAPAPYSAPSAYYSPTIGRMSGLEVLKGSSQVLYGPHSTGGVVNYLSTPIPAEATTYLKGIYAENGEYRGHLYHGNTIDTDVGRIGYLLETYARRADGFKDIDGSSRDTGFHRFEPMVKLSWEPKTEIYQRFEAKWGYTYLNADETYLGLSEEDFDDDPYRRYAASREDNIRTQQYRSYLRHYIEPTETLNIETTAYYNKFHRNWFKLRKVNGNSLSAALAGANAGADLATLRGEAPGTWGYRHNSRDYYAWGVQSILEQEFEVCDSLHFLKFGVRYHEDQVRRFQQNETYTVDGTGTIVAIAPGAPGGGGDREQNTRAVATFLQDEIQVGAWTLTPGIRWERMRFDYIDYNGGDKGKGGLHTLSGGIGLTYDVNEQTQFFGGFHRGTSPPGPRAHLKSDVVEEKAYATELGVRYEAPDGALKIESTLFHTLFKDLVVAGNIGGGGAADTENVGEVEVIGVELAAVYDLGIERGWSFSNPYFLTATYTHAELKGDAKATDAESIFAGGRDGNQVPYVPLYIITAGTGLEFNRWGFEVSGSYVDAAFTTADNTDEQINGVTGTPDSRFGKTDDAFVVDVTAHVKLRDNITLSGGVQNLGDREYVVSRHPEGPRPGKPRTAWVGLEFVY